MFPTAAVRVRRGHTPIQGTRVASWVMACRCHPFSGRSSWCVAPARLQRQPAFPYETRSAAGGVGGVGSAMVLVRPSCCICHRAGAVAIRHSPARAQPIYTGIYPLGQTQVGHAARGRVRDLQFTGIGRPICSSCAQGHTAPHASLSRIILRMRPQRLRFVVAYDHLNTVTTLTLCSAASSRGSAGSGPRS